MNFHDAQVFSYNPLHHNGIRDGGRKRDFWKKSKEEKEGKKESVGACFFCKARSLWLVGLIRKFLGYVGNIG